LLSSPEEVCTMMTIVTHIQVKPGSEGEWDRTMQERLRAAEGRPGSEAWHRDPTFRETGTRRGGLEARSAQESWHEVLEERGLAA
jgi:hypothetical protein